jgi:hypothetical protein
MAEICHHNLDQLMIPFLDIDIGTSIDGGEK